uniref:MCL1 apoptosis regulator, BCL2 family member b n=1 Tax=Neogobius melanostomus TaxID=47308 RepID=A0A8C6SW38_9GOBI
MLPAKRTKFGIPTTMLGMLMPQNGVVEAEGAMTMDARNGNGSLSHCHPQQQRPTALQVKNDHSRKHKNLREGDYDHNSDGGSLPCTPEFQSDSEQEMSGYSVENDTRQLLGDFFELITGISQPGWLQRPALTTMKRVVDNLLEKHRIAYNGRLNLPSNPNWGDDVTFMGDVARSIFEDGTTNWGRIASLISFGAVVCQYLKSKGRESCVERVAEEISSYLLSDQRDWLIRNNSWDGFVEFFRVDDPESKVRNTLMAVAGLAGIGATLAMLIR